MPNLFTPIFVGLAVLTPIYSTLYYTNKVKAKEESKRGIMSASMLASAAYLFLFVIIHDSIIPVFQSWFFDGAILSKEVLVTPDEGGQDYYDSQLYFEFFGHPSINSVGGVRYLMLMILIGGLALNYYFISQYERGKKDDVEYNIQGGHLSFLIITRFVLAIGLFICLLNMPSQYYTVLRFVMMFGCIYLAAGAHKKEDFIGWTFFVSIAILFNPIYEINLTRVLWNAIDISVAIIMLAGAVKAYIDSRS
ncbi:MAG: DUF6804 family protein [Nitrososphaerales archaeon]